MMRIANVMSLILIFNAFVFTSCNANHSSDRNKILSKNGAYDGSEEIEKKEGGENSKSSDLQLGGTYLPDFKSAAKKSVDAVVHVKSLVEGRPMTYEDVIMEFFFGYKEPRKQEPMLFSTGSGVIVSEDGYIVTNNHVIKGADQVRITMNDRRDYIAEIVGTDSRTDIAVLKINEQKLPIIPFGSSEDLELGEWVLAIGNPFRLSTTVTAGIVSAKARDINILSGGDRTAIESFIQTDAAVNPGNSGGALVNLKGELVGINTAIASPTGSFAGYSFAIPSVIVEKVVEDIISTGKVQRGVMGITIRDIDEEIAARLRLKVFKGVYVEAVYKYGAAYRAGILPGDLILEIEGVSINTMAELQGKMAQYSPEDKVLVKVKRNNKTETFNVKLRRSE